MGNPSKLFWEPRSLTPKPKRVACFLLKKSTSKKYQMNMWHQQIWSPQNGSKMESLIPSKTLLAWKACSTNIPNRSDGSWRGNKVKEPQSTQKRHQNPTRNKVFFPTAAFLGKIEFSTNLENQWKPVENNHVWSSMSRGQCSPSQVSYCISISC